MIVSIPPLVLRSKGISVLSTPVSYVTLIVPYWHIYLELWDSQSKLLLHLSE